AYLHGARYRVFRYGPKNLCELYRKAWSLGADEVVVTANRKVAYRDVLRRASRLSLSLGQYFGIKSGDRVAISLENRVEAIVGFIAITSMGATAVLIGPFPWTGFLA